MFEVGGVGVAQGWSGEMDRAWKEVQAPHFSEERRICQNRWVAILCFLHRENLHLCTWGSCWL